MYLVKRNVSMPKVLKNKFASYEEARNAIRKWLRAKYGAFQKNTIPITSYGFSIAKQ